MLPSNNLLSVYQSTLYCTNVGQEYGQEHVEHGQEHVWT